jgi:signal transduction histidine kinase/AmiR/NasT family two-component response regulator
MAIAPARPKPSAFRTTGVIHRRRKEALLRLALAAITAMVLSPMLGGWLCVGWLAGYFLLQGLDAWTFNGVPNPSGGKVATLRRVACWLSLVANAAWFSSLSVPLWLIGGPAGGVCALILLMGACTYAMINATGSATVMTLSTGPHFLYMTATPVYLALDGSDPAPVFASAVAVGIFLMFILAVWTRMSAAHDSEKNARTEADQKRGEMEKLMEGRSAFLAAIAHDLRTPISAILAGSSELERHAGDNNGRSNARLIGDAGQMMKAMLDDLLDHAKLDAGRMTVEAVDFNLRDQLSQTVRLWNGSARAKGLKLRVEGSSSVPVSVRGDPMRLRQILNNVMSNAMKFTETGSITLRLTAWTEEPSGHALLIDVIDTGSGMTPDQLSRLFKPFDQTADGISAVHGGTGLGLAISQQLAHLMGGRLTARSTPGAGAAFTLALTLENARAPVEVSRAIEPASRTTPAQVLATVQIEPSPPRMKARPPEIPAASATEPDVDVGVEERPMRVLVVDDHEINRRAIQLILQPLGCDIATAADGLAALAICDKSAFDLIFMDVRMPELDGRETTRRIRAGDGPNARTPIIAVTADTDPKDIQACTDAGMTYFVPKPLTPASLLGAVSHVMTLEAQALETEEAA